MKNSAHLAVLVLVMIAGLYSLDYAYNYAEQSAFGESITGAVSGGSETKEELQERLVEQLYVLYHYEGKLSYEQYLRAYDAITNGYVLPTDVAAVLPKKNTRTLTQQYLTDKTITSAEFYAADFYSSLWYFGMYELIESQPSSAGVTAKCGNAVRENSEECDWGEENANGVWKDTKYDCGNGNVVDAKYICSLYCDLRYRGFECTETEKITETEKAQETTTKTETKSSSEPKKELCQWNKEKGKYVCTTNNKEYDREEKCKANCRAEQKPVAKAATTTTVEAAYTCSNGVKSTTGKCSEKCGASISCEGITPGDYTTYCKANTNVKQYCDSNCKIVDSAVCGSCKSLSCDGIKPGDYTTYCNYETNMKQLCNNNCKIQDGTLECEKTQGASKPATTEPAATTTVPATETKKSETKQELCQLNKEKGKYVCTTTNKEYGSEERCVGNCKLSTGQQPAEETEPPAESPPVSVPNPPTAPTTLPGTTTDEPLPVLLEPKPEPAKASGSSVDLVVEVAEVMDVNGNPVAELFAGVDYRVKVVVKNQGGGKLPVGSAFYTLLYLDAGAANRRVRVDSYALSSVDFNQNQKAELVSTWKVPETLQAGEYELLAIADTQSVITEMKEDNNEHRKPVTIKEGGGGNLAVEKVEAVPRAGNVFDVKATVKNDGRKRVYIGDKQQATESGAGVITFVRVDAVIKKGGSVVCSGNGFIYDSLEAGASVDVQVYIKKGSGQCALERKNNYAIEVAVDSNGIIEASKDDNEGKAYYAFGFDSALKCPGTVGKDIPFGFRQGNTYCEDGKLVAQKSGGQSCSNSFECLSNVCAAGECIESSAFKKLLCSLGLC